jgi:hypothetical protein
MKNIGLNMLIQLTWGLEATGLSGLSYMKSYYKIISDNYK